MGDLEFMLFHWYSEDTDITVNESYQSSSEGSNDDIESVSDPSDDDEYDFNQGNQIKHYKIYLFGINRKGSSICVVVDQFTPYFYVKCPQHWLNSDVDLWSMEIRSKVPNYISRHIKSITIVKKKCAKGYKQNNTFRFLRIVCDNLQALKHLRYTIPKKYPRFQLYNSDVDPMLLFMHTKDIQPCGWIKIKEGKYNTINLSRTDECYKVYWNDIKPFESNEIAPLKILSFDIECFNPDGVFPVATNINDKIIQIGSSIQRHNCSTITKNVHVLRECDSVNDCEINTFKSESKLLKNWFNYIKSINPDLIIGYNIDGFDWEYIIQRCKILNVDFSSLTRLYHVKAKSNLHQMQSNAYGMNTFKYIDIPGINQLDLLFYFKRTYKLSSYKLDAVAKEFLNESKRPVSPREIFEMGGPKGNSKSRSIVADYCAQDTLLPLRLLSNQIILPNLIEMSKCTYIPFVWLIHRGQQIKVYSQVQRELRKNNYVLPTGWKKKMASTEKYQGATVLDCKRGAYLDHPVSGLDFKSLYPSIIVEKNLCITTIILDPKEANGVETHHFKWDTYDYKVVKKECQPGIISNIIKRLMIDRMNVKKEMKENKKNQVVYDVLDAKQKAIKVVMNSIYGIFGSFTGPLSMKPIAMIITYRGRKMIEHTKQMAESLYDGSAKSKGVKAQVIYGDSVRGHMPITMNINNHIIIKRIDSLNMSKWYSYESGDRSKSQAKVPNCYIYTGNGWVKPIRVIRHKVKKKLYRVLTQKGIVECTGDHSLFRKYTLEQVKPNELIKGEEIFHNYIKPKLNVTSNMTNGTKERQRLFYQNIK